MIQLFHSSYTGRFSSNKEDTAHLKLKVSVWNPRSLATSQPEAKEHG